jgi:integrase/recombinase XerD
MTTSELVRIYLEAKRAHGVNLRSGQRALFQFARETGDRPLAELTPEAVATFLRGRGNLSASWRTKHALLGGLYRFAIARAHVAVSPMPEHRPRLPPPIMPYVYSHHELQRLLDATSMLESPCSPLQGRTYRTLLLVLYATGLRVSEALRLTLADVDLVDHVLTVKDTKFYKTRLVPFGNPLAGALGKYMEQRGTLPMPAGPASALLSSRTGHRLDYQRVVTLFQHLRARADIGCPAGEHRPPRLHDLRHTAAVHRVVSWYRQGRDVQRLLPYLATYLGHASIASTQRYLQMTPELLQQASLRFAAYADVQLPTEAAHA